MNERTGEAEATTARFAEGEIVADFRDEADPHAVVPPWVGAVKSGFDGPSYAPGWTYRLLGPEGFEWTAKAATVRRATATERADYRRRRGLPKG
ncbi:hypothetical protein [Streptomyces sp. NPDC048172]|uniref:hypothetical protein n=1 Tax=Streptomyces sp. NPDC048172 TaxID=3365505 RepID=UPI00370FF5A6